MVVFITGGLGGLGLETVRRFHKEGCKVAIADIDSPDKVDHLKAELGGDRLLYFQCNISNEEDVKSAIEGTAKQWGTIHVAITCAGITRPMLTLSRNGPFNSDVFKKLFEINVYGSLYVAKHAAVLMSKNKPVNDKGERGVIIFVSSIAAEEGQRGQISYSASKGAINGLVMPMARDLGRFGIRCAAIAPGIIETPMFTKKDPKIKARLKRDTPMGRLGSPEEFAHFA